MKLIIGLGNPSPEYEKTRHNAGFLVLEKFLQKQSEVEEWRLKKKSGAEIIETKIEKEKIILARPQTFMNKSGEAASWLMKFYKIQPSDILVIHDDLDLPLGALRLKQGGSSAGHQGVESIIQAIGPDFIRVRLGIAPQNRVKRAERFVLEKFTAAEVNKLEPQLTRAAAAIVLIIQEGLSKAMSLYNQKT